jgi:hypothetical protein
MGDYRCEGCGKTSRIAAHEPWCPVLERQQVSKVARPDVSVAVALFVRVAALHEVSPASGARAGLMLAAFLYRQANLPREEFLEIVGRYWDGAELNHSAIQEVMNEHNEHNERNLELDMQTFFASRGIDMFQALEVLIGAVCRTAVKAVGSARVEEEIGTMVRDAILKASVVQNVQGDPS